MTEEFDAELAAERFLRYLVSVGKLDVDELAMWLDNGQDSIEWHRQIEAVGNLLNRGNFAVDWIQ